MLSIFYLKISIRLAIKLTLTEPLLNKTYVIEMTYSIASVFLLTETITFEFS